jgi:hypothetical protein
MQENTPMRIILLFLAIIGMSSNCTKQSHDGEGAGLEGKWAKKQTLISPGPMGTWENYNGAPAYLNFRNNGSIESTGAATIGDQYDRYRVFDHYITFYKNASTDSLQTTFSIEDNELIIWFPCIEPCGIKLKRVK